MLTDMAELQGVWKQVAAEENGVTNPSDEYGGASLTTFHQNHFAVRAPDGVLLLEGRFVLDATTTPKSIDWLDAIGPDAGKVLPAIYRLEGDHFIFIAADAGAPRPMEFRTGPGQTMRSFVRQS